MMVFDWEGVSQLSSQVVRQVHVRVHWVEHSCSQFPLVYFRVKRGEPDPAAQSVRALADHDGTGHMDNFEVAPQMDGKQLHLFDQLMETR